MKHSKLDKIKPLLKVLTIFIIISGIGFGGYSLLNSGSVHNNKKDNPYADDKHDNIKTKDKNTEQSNSDQSSSKNANSYEYQNGSSNKKYIDPKTGCDYSVSESEYIACLDRYNANNSSTGQTYVPPQYDSSPNSVQQAPIQNEPNNGNNNSNNGSSSNNSDKYAALNACLAELNKYPSGASRERARQYCYEVHTPR